MLESVAKQMVALEALKGMLNDLDNETLALKARVEECEGVTTHLHNMTDNLVRGVAVVDYAIDQ